MNVVVTAEDNQQAQSTNHKWWYFSALEDTLDRGKVLYHFDGNLAFNQLSGNIDGTALNTKILNTLRYYSFTLHLDYLIDFAKITTYDDNSGTPASIHNTKTSKQVVEVALDYDLSKIFYIESGMIWERDFNKSILNRNSYYLGLGLNSHINKEHVFSLIAAAGIVDIEYDLPKAVLDNFNVQKKPDDYLFFIQSYSWTILQNLEFREMFKYFPNISETERYRYELDLSVNSALWEFISVFIAYKYCYDNDAKNIFIYPRDTKLTCGINLQF
jgi:hypothetical protein